MVHRIGDKVPEVKKAAFIAWNAEVCGQVDLAEDVNVWFSATIRGDIAPITVGRGTNIQDSATLHVDHNAPLSVGAGVTVGHNAVLHGCTIGDGCLIGMGAVILSGAVIGGESIVGAGALVTEHKVFPPRSLIIGNPARAVRTIDVAAIGKILENSRNYVQLGKQAAREYEKVE
jgi:carbonic anhydrase/acetyltransferase-like protein (isoleucine patch superfamily)